MTQATGGVDIKGKGRMETYLYAGDGFHALERLPSGSVRVVATGYAGIALWRLKRAATAAALCAVCFLAGRRSKPAAATRK